MQIILILAVIIAALVIYAALQPSDFGVTRSKTMMATPDKIFAQVNDLQAWDAWSPWAKLDPNAKITFEGAPQGRGAVMRWAGNMKIGEGSMTITESHPIELVGLRLDFLKPMKATNTAEFTFKPKGSQTMVTWSMKGTKNLMSKIMGLFFSCEKMVGSQFEKGLAQLQAVVEVVK